MAKKNALVDALKEYAKLKGDTDLLNIIELSEPKKVNRKKKSVKKKSPPKKSPKKTATPPKKDDDSDHIFRANKKPVQNRQKTDENGNVVGTLTRSEPICLKQKFFDDGKTDKKDPINKKLKKLTKVSKRTRPPGLVKIQCSGTCGRTLEVSRQLLRDGEYTCDKCIMKKGGYAS